MMKVTQGELLRGVHFTSVHTDKFKTSTLSLHFCVPLGDEYAAVNALVPMVLRRGCAQYPDQQSLAAALDARYGAALEVSLQKKGETQCLGFYSSFLDDAFALDGSTILEPMAELFGALLLDPCLEKGLFLPEYVEGERVNLLQQIAAQVNEKRAYASLRLVTLMCADESYGVSKRGSKERAEAITPEALQMAYAWLLEYAQVEIFYCGAAPSERVEAALRVALKGLPRAEGIKALNCCVQDNATKPVPCRFEEALDVTQGKLALGFRTGGLSLGDEGFPALLVLCAIYGGTPTSKLFLNVREKLSLCYFASSALEPIKGIMIVSSGVEFDQREAAEREILVQFEACKKGEIEPWELEGGRRAVVSSLKTALDSQWGLSDYWMTRAVCGEADDGPESLAQRVEAVTLEQVVGAAQGFELDSIYFLKGQEGSV